MLLELSRFGDLQLALDQGDFEAATRLGRSLSDGLRLIQEELGWDDESERAQEEFRAVWDQTALVRDTCAEVLPALDEGTATGAPAG